MKGDKWIIWASLRVDGDYSEPEKREFHYIYFRTDYKMYCWTTDLTQAHKFATKKEATSCPDYIYGYLELHPECRYGE